MHSRLPQLAGAAFVIALAASSPAAAQTAALSGVTRDAGTSAPIANVQISVQSGIRLIAATTSREDGRYTMPPVATGTYTVVAQRIGYAARRIGNVAIAAGATLDIAMAQASTVLNPSVTTASRGVVAEKILDTPANVQLVDGAKIATTPAATVADFLRTVPGLSVSTGGLVQSNTVSHGFNNAFSGQMLNLQDYRFSGVPSLRVNVPFLYTSTMDDVERLEVLNGPASALYGPNSSNGVLHIITKSPFDSRGTSVTVDGGGQSVLRAAIRHAGVVADGKLGYKVSGEYFTGQDWKYYDPNEPANYPSTAPAGRAGTPVQRDFLDQRVAGEARLDYRASSELENTLTAGISHIGSGIEITTAFGAEQVKNWEYRSIQDRFRYKRLFGQVFYNSSDAGNSSPSDLSGTHSLRTGTPIVDRSSVLVAQLQQGMDVFGSKLIAGADYILTKPRSEGTIFGRNEGNTDILEYGTYLQSTIPLHPRLELMSAVRADWTDRLKGSQFSPQAALLYRINSVNNLRLMFSRAFASPASFSYFLDAVSNPNQAPGFALRAIGNPPKSGFQFSRGCDATINAGLCMRSPFIAQGGGATVNSSATVAFPGFIAALPSIINGLPNLTAVQKQQLLGLIGPQGVGPILGALRPTPAQVGTALVLNGKPVAATTVKDIDPLSASFNNTTQVGYRGIIRDRLRVAVDAWYQVRGDVGAPIGQANPLVMYDPATLSVYLTASITGGLMQAGLPQAQAAATAQAAAGALVPLMAQLPQGTLALNNTGTAANPNDPSIIATYTNAQGHVYVHGVDLGLDWQLTPTWALNGSYSNQDKITFESIGGAGNPLMSNTPKHRGSLGARYGGEAAAWGFDGTVRYSDAFPVNSGLFNSLTPNPSGGATYPSVPAQTQVDLGASYRLPIAQDMVVSLMASNVLDNRAATFVGTPNIGRLVLTRLKYTF